MRQIGINPGSLFGKEPGGFSICLGMAQVNLIMSSIKIAAQHHLLTRSLQIVTYLEQVGVKLELIGYAIHPALSTGEIYIEQAKIREFAMDNPTFQIKLIPSDAITHSQRFGGGKCSHTTISRPDCWVPIYMLGGELSQIFSWYLLWTGLDLL